MSFEVLILPEAERDLAERYLYVAGHDSRGHADKLLDTLEQTCTMLCMNPETGHAVPELDRVYVPGFREIHFKPWRILYQVTGERVFVHAVLDGRRDLQELLERRLLRQA
jgi:toxin ParE1/3/4